MLRTIFYLLSLLSLTSTNAQPAKSIEISIPGRYDRQADYVTNFGRSFNDTLKLFGKSYGANIIYRRQVSEDISISIGIGYYRAGIDKIKGSGPYYRVHRNIRAIDYSDDSTRFLYGTSKYHYNDLTLSMSLNKTISMHNSYYLDLGAEAIVYYSISQRYEIMPGGSMYSTNNAKPLEFGANLNFGVLKEYRRFYIRPALIIPVYQNLKGDKVFYEYKNMNIPKWFHGIGLMVRIGKYI